MLFLSPRHAPRVSWTCTHLSTVNHTLLSRVTRLWLSLTWNLWSCTVIDKSYGGFGSWSHMVPRCRIQSATPQKLAVFAPASIRLAVALPITWLTVWPNLVVSGLSFFWAWLYLSSHLFLRFQCSRQSKLYRNLTGVERTFGHSGNHGNTVAMSLPSHSCKTKQFCGLN